MRYRILQQLKTKPKTQSNNNNNNNNNNKPQQPKKLPRRKLQQQLKANLQLYSARRIETLLWPSQKNVFFVLFLFQIKSVHFINICI